MKQQFCLINDKVKRNVVNFIQSLPVDHRSPLIIEAREESRTDKQNRLMWPLLKDLSDQVICFRHDLAPGIQRLTCTIGNNGSGPVGQLIQTFGVIEQHSRRRAPQWRIKGHVFAPKKHSPKRGFVRNVGDFYNQQFQGVIKC